MNCKFLLKMKSLTNKECEALLLIFKDFKTDYNANSISKKLNITPRGALKILKKLYSENILASKQMGKAVFYKINTEDVYATKLIEMLLIKQSREHAKKWISEFEKIFKEIKMAVIYGSVLRNQKEAHDIDLLLIIDKGKYKIVKKFIDEKNTVLTIPLHPLIMTLPDIKNNLHKQNPALINAIKEGCVLYGYDIIVEVLKDVAGFK